MRCHSFKNKILNSYKTKGIFIQLWFCCHIWSGMSRNFCYLMWAHYCWTALALLTSLLFHNIKLQHTWSLVLTSVQQTLWQYRVTKNSNAFDCCGQISSSVLIKSSILDLRIWFNIFTYTKSDRCDAHFPLWQLSVLITGCRSVADCSSFSIVIPVWL